MGYKSPGVLLEVVVIKREVKALALNCASGKRGRLAILCSDRTQQFKFDRAFGAIILAIKSSGVSSKSSSSSAKLKRLLLTVPVESGRRLAILGSDRTRQFKSDRAFGAVILAIK